MNNNSEELKGSVNDILEDHMKDIKDSVNNDMDEMAEYVAGIKGSTAARMAKNRTIIHNVAITVMIVILLGVAAWAMWFCMKRYNIL